MRLLTFLFLLIVLKSTLFAIPKEHPYLTTCKENPNYTSDICSCSYKLFTRKLDPSLLGKPKTTEQLKKYVKACRTIQDKLQVYTYGRLEQIIQSGREIGWERLHHKQRDKMIDIINQSRRLYFKACHSGFGQGCYNVALLYSKGLSKDINMKKANEYLQKACRNGFDTVCSKE